MVWSYLIFVDSEEIQEETLAMDVLILKLIDLLLERKYYRKNARKIYVL